jgi:hypothetical protein
MRKSRVRKVTNDAIDAELVARYLLVRYNNGMFVML